MAKPKKGGLGRGLGALISPKAVEGAPEVAGQPIAATQDDRILHLDPREIAPNPGQPRVHFDEERLEELCESIRREGVIEPVIVRQRGDGYELVSGERRVKASIMAEAATVPAVVRDVDDMDMLKLGLIENIQREDLNAIETACAYQRLIDELKWTQEELATQVGKKRATVTNTLRLLNLPQVVQDRVADGSITMGHARALLAIEKAEDQIKACHKIISQGLSVRQVEKLAQPAKPKKKAGGGSKDPNVAAIEDELRRKLGTKVALRPQGKDMQRGKIEIEFYSLDELERLLEFMRKVQ